MVKHATHLFQEEVVEHVPLSMMDNVGIPSPALLDHKWIVAEINKTDWSSLSLADRSGHCVFSSVTLPRDFTLMWSAEHYYLEEFSWARRSCSYIAPVMPPKPEKAVSCMQFNDLRENRILIGQTASTTCFLHRGIENESGIFELNKLELNAERWKVLQWMYNYTFTMSMDLTLQEMLHDNTLNGSWYLHVWYFKYNLKTI